MNIRIRNLTSATSVPELLGCFEAYGVVTDININTYSLDGETKVLGFVEMPSSDHGKAAIAGLEGKVLGGATLIVREE